MKVWTNPKLWQFRREDYRVTRVFIAVAGVLGCLPLVEALWHVARGEVIWEAQEGDQEIPLSLPGAHGRSLGMVRWVVEHPSAGQVVGAVLPGAVTAVVAVLGCLLTMRLTLRMERAEPFGAANLDTARRLVLLLLGYAVGGWAARAFGEMLVMAPLRFAARPHGPVFLFTFRIDPLDIALCVSGFLLLLVAEAFQQGHRQQQDLVGLV